MKTIKICLLALCLSVFQISVSAKTPKYVFYMIGDGMGINHAVATEYYMHEMGMGDLNFFHFPVTGFVTTYSASKRVTDSAAAGTALSTGFKTKNGTIGQLPDSTVVQTLSEKAGLAGKGVGIITSDGLNQATPSAFYGHTAKRGNSDELVADLLAADVDFAAGATFYTKEHDPEYWIAKAEEQGIKVFYGQNKYTPVRGSRVIYLSDDLGKSALPYAIDRKEGNRSLEDFTTSAIDYLYSNFKNGFFLMIEGANIDHTAHSQDAAATVKEVLDFAISVEHVLAFYRSHPDETLIVVTADHETGGCTISNGDLSILKDQTASKTGITNAIAALSKSGREVCWSEVKALLSGSTGLWDKVPVSREEEVYLAELYKKSFIDGVESVEKDLYHSNQKIASEAVRYINSNAGFNFNTGSHTGAAVGLYAIGVGAEKLTACRDNTEIPKTVAKIAGYKQ